MRKIVKSKSISLELGVCRFVMNCFFVERDIAGPKYFEEISAEIEIIPISEDITEIRVANLVMKPNEVWFDFFSSIYQLCYKKWPFFTKTDPDISDFWSFDFLDIKDFIIDNVKSHGFNEEYYMSGKFLVVSGDFDTEQRRQRLIEDLSRRLPPIEVFETDTFLIDRDGEEVNLTQVEQRKGGRRNLPHGEWIYRLAKAQEAEKIKAGNPDKTWREIMMEIEWKWGSSPKSKIKLLEYARNDLSNADSSTLLEIEDYRRKEKKKI